MFTELFNIHVDMLEVLSMSKVYVKRVFSKNQAVFDVAPPGYVFYAESGQQQQNEKEYNTWFYDMFV